MSIIFSSQYKYQGPDPLAHIRHTDEGNYECIQVWSGEGSFVINDTSYPMRPGAVFLIDPEFFHCSAPQDGANYVRSKLFLSRTPLQQAARAVGFWEPLERIFRHGGTALYFSDGNTTVEKIDRLLQRLCLEKPESPLQCAMDVLQLLDLLLQQESTALPHDALLDRIIHVINRSLANTVTIEQLSREIFVNKYYLCRYFKSRTGIALMDYVNLRRITMAKELLLSTSAPIADIAEQCGYNSPSYFSKKFRELTGITPREFRRR